MESAQSFDTRIVYLCVVNQTGSKEILENFLKTGGWAQIAKWLTAFAEKNQFAGIREVLKCLQKLPVTVDTLKLKVPEGSEVPGKMVRKLRKNEDQKIKELSTSIFKAWTTLLEQDNAKKEAKKAKKRELEKAEKKAKGPQCTLISILTGQHRSPRFSSRDCTCLDFCDSFILILIIITRFVSAS